MNFNMFKSNLKNFGLAKALADVALRAVNRILVLRVLKGIKIERVDATFLEADSMYRGLFLTEEMLREFAADPKNELSGAFLDEALSKGDECYGFVCGSTLSAYGWYSRRPTDLDLPGLRLHFDDRYVYMYKGFTAASHRGKRLHAVGMTCALESYLGRGYRGIVSYVEWDNFCSLRSCYRMGYRDFSAVTIVGGRGYYIIYHDRGCSDLRFRVEHIRKPHEGWLDSRSMRAS